MANTEALESGARSAQEIFQSQAGLAVGGGEQTDSPGGKAMRLLVSERLMLDGCGCRCKTR